MLADDIGGASVGNFDVDLHLPETFLREILQFIASCLPSWRDDPNRKVKHTKETALTSHLCKFLNSASRKSQVDHVGFTTEDPDAVNGGRTIDLTPSPSRCIIWINNREYTYYDALIPIECKRLPTPDLPRRERREYLHTRRKTTGGVQRFMLGLHGADHELGAMIGYVQTRAVDDWMLTLNHWINALASHTIGPWKKTDKIVTTEYNVESQTIIGVSCHTRAGCAPIELWHLLIKM